MQVDVKAYMAVEEIADMIKAKAQAEVERAVTALNFEIDTQGEKPVVTGVSITFGKKIQSIMGHR